MDNQAARVIDPVQTTVARGYRTEMHIHNKIFPRVPVQTRGGKIVSFGAEHFVQRDLRRAPGAAVQRMEIGYASDDFAIIQRALAGQVPRERVEEAAAVPNIALQTLTTRRTLDNISLQVEIEAADLVQESDNYSAGHTETLAGDAQWSSDNSVPSVKVQGVKEVIAQKIGVRPNTILVGAGVHDRLLNHADVIDRVKHATGLDNPQVDGMKLQNYFGGDLEYCVGYAMKGEEGAFQRVWNDIVWIGYVARSTLAQAEGDMGEPSFSYNYTLDGYPMAEEIYYDRENRTFVSQVTVESRCVIAGKDAGYLIEGVLAD